MYTAPGCGRSGFLYPYQFPYVDAEECEDQKESYVITPDGAGAGGLFCVQDVVEGALAGGR